LVAIILSSIYAKIRILLLFFVASAVTSHPVWCQEGEPNVSSSFMSRDPCRRDLVEVVYRFILPVVHFANSDEDCRPEPAIVSRSENICCELSLIFARRRYRIISGFISHVVELQSPSSARLTQRQQQRYTARSASRTAAEDESRVTPIDILPLTTSK
jgi:hypothetical protein